jgi:hypothetical protein
MKIFKVQTIGKAFYFERNVEAELTANIHGSKVEVIEPQGLSVHVENIDLNEVTFFVEPIRIYFTVSYNHALDNHDGRILYEIKEVVSIQDDDGTEIPMLKKVDNHLVPRFTDDDFKTLMILAESYLVTSQRFADEIFEHHKNMAE